MANELLDLLEAGRRKERAQTRFYRGLAAEAEARGDEALVDRFNDLHADEQHHLSKLSVRIMELGASPEPLEKAEASPPALDAWEREAQLRENAEVEWYEEALKAELDALTREVLSEILESERNHARDLGGKWMSA